MSVLVLVEHEAGVPKDASLSTVTAAQKLGEVHALVAGSGAEARQAADATARIAGVAFFPTVSCGCGPGPNTTPLASRSDRVHASLGRCPSRMRWNIPVGGEKEMS